MNREWATKNENGVRASRAIQKAHAWLWDRNNMAEAIAILEKHSKQPKDICEKVYRSYFIDGEMYSKTGAVDVSGLQTVLNDMAADGQVFTKAPEARKFLLEKQYGGLAAG